MAKRRWNTKSVLRSDDDAEQQGKKLKSDGFELYDQSGPRDLYRRELKSAVDADEPTPATAAPPKEPAVPVHPNLSKVEAATE